MVRGKAVFVSRGDAYMQFDVRARSSRGGRPSDRRRRARPERPTRSGKRARGHGRYTPLQVRLWERDGEKAARLKR